MDDPGRGSPGPQRRHFRRPQLRPAATGPEPPCDPCSGECGRAPSRPMILANGAPRESMPAESGSVAVAALSGMLSACVRMLPCHRKRTGGKVRGSLCKWSFAPLKLKSSQNQYEMQDPTKQYPGAEFSEQTQP